MLTERKDIKNLIDRLHAEGKTVVTTNGCFDILHAGHVRYLEKAKSFADKLIVLLNSDKSVKNIKGEGRPINNENDRAEVLSALKSVDYVVLFDEDSPRGLLEEIKPDIHAKGADYTAETLPEADVILNSGGKLEFIEFVAGRSTTNIIEKVNKSEQGKF
ncbi:MAG: D-glycero-beta-D-manno-heptose 1-phosphate adenylyltransferase [Heliobacteriaceae bacterium]|jgi:rfaE bifunctional protein nucleotidyltransferase chain/domain|nr:D-glycero-beta-D-manno-heptose 1-phosphate adenylyltransferase [Heliobacteriaceae bacterium]